MQKKSHVHVINILTVFLWGQGNKRFLRLCESIKDALCSQERCSSKPVDKDREKEKKERVKYSKLDGAKQLVDYKCLQNSGPGLGSSLNLPEKGRNREAGQTGPRKGM